MSETLALHFCQLPSKQHLQHSVFSLPDNAFDAFPHFDSLNAVFIAFLFHAHKHVQAVKIPICAHVVNEK